MSQKEREQLSAEIQILKELRHPNIVQYFNRAHDRDTSDVHLYMEYCGNGDLGRVIKQLKREHKYADEEFVWSIFSQTVSALYRCHYGEDPPEVGGVTGVLVSGRGIKPHTKTGRMILHRDLKPENIFLGEDNSVKLGDFGLSKIIASHDFASTYVGTPFYMSPEICAAERYTLHSDIWSLGCIMYELCMKEPPFNAKTHFDLIQKIKLGKTAPLPAIYSDELKNVISTCLRVDPTKRPDTAQLINLPVVKLMRKEAEAVSLGQQLRVERDRLVRKQRDIDERIKNLDGKMEEARKQTDDRLRLEWEVKAQLEIDRQVNVRTANLEKVFEEEVQKRVEAEVSRRLAALRDQDHVPSQTPPRPRVASNGLNPLDINKSWSTLGEASEFPSQTDLSDLSDLTLESPSVARKGPRPSLSGNDLGGRPARTPFTRAKTMMATTAAQSPMDIQMADPSPVPLKALGLSPRRTQPGAQPNWQTAASNANALAVGKNIFATAAAFEKWEPTNASNLPSLSDVENSDAEDGDDENEVENIPVLPSPSRKVSNNMDPFKPRPTKQTSRPSLGAAGRTKTMPNALHRVNGQPRLASAPSLFGAPQTQQQSTATNAAQVKSRPNSAVPVVATSPPRKPPSSPGRTSPRKPPMAAACKTSENGLQSKKGRYDDLIMRQAAGPRNPLTGRTLVELAQARAGGRDLAVMPATESDCDDTKAAGARARKALDFASPAKWDPETDDMPSPFLKKGVRVVR